MSSKHIVILVENLPVPFDRRVWQEARALREAGHSVSVICPATEDYPSGYEELNGVDIYRHPLPEASSKWEYFLEYPLALLSEWFLTARIWWRDEVDAIHACNPPDLLWLVALPFTFGSTKFVFDHHDICPELFETKFGDQGLIYKLMIWLEKQSFGLAEKSIATNESYRAVAVERGEMDPEDVYVVRSAPDLEKFDRLLEEVRDDLPETNGVEVGYVGVMGDQEGIDLLLEAAERIKGDRNDIHFTLIGDGPAAGDLRSMAEAKDLGEIVEFTGRVSDRELVRRLAGSDICVNPDRATPMNDKSTMNKIMEYMALSKPIVQFDLTEGRFSAKDASLYARENDPNDLADKIKELADDPSRRKEMGRLGRRRLEDELSWKNQKETLTRLYEDLFDR